ncbi:MAG: hypothetical protein ACRDOU_04970 [Streptosporangiaceae bacterium]
MYTNSQNINQIGSERQRDALARAEQQRRAQRLRTSARDAEHPEQHPRRARRPMAWLLALTTHRRP